MQQHRRGSQFPPPARSSQPREPVARAPAGDLSFPPRGFHHPGASFPESAWSFHARGAILVRLAADTSKGRFRAHQERLHVIADGYESESLRYILDRELGGVCEDPRGLRRFQGGAEDTSACLIKLCTGEDAGLA